jgi:hypothetical protein
LDIIAMAPFPILKNKNEFMLTPVKRAHARVIFGPHAQVFEFGVRGTASFEHLGYVAPIHADVMKTPLSAVISQVTEGACQESSELGLAHFACPHRELAMPDFSVSAEVPRNANVVGRIGEDNIGFAIAH